MSSDIKYYRLASRIFADFSGSIAIPAVSAALLGKWIDAQQGTEPRYLLLLLIISFGFTGVLLVRKAKKYKKQYESLLNSKN